MQASRIFLTGGAALAVLIATVGSATADPENRANTAVQTQTARSAPVETSSGKGPLSPRLQEIAADKPKGAAELAAAVEASGLPNAGPWTITRGPDLTLEVTIRVKDVSESMRRALRAAGSRIMAVSKETSSYRAFVAPKNLLGVAAVRHVIAVTEVLGPQPTNPGERAAASRVSAAVGAQACSPTISVADTQLKAALARTNFGVDGTGIKVGVISSSYANTTTPTSAAQDVASGNLPGIGNPCGRTTPVQVLSDGGGSSDDEGRAMLQLIHKLAPGATLMFANQADLPGKIRSLRAAGADVIVDDSGVPSEPIFQDGPTGKAISEVVAAGVTYLSAAGNNNQVIAGVSGAGSIEMPSLRPTTCPPALAPPVAPVDSCLDFSPNGGSPSSTAWYEVPPSPASGPGMLFVGMYFSEPLYGVTDDLDLYFLDETGTTILGVSDSDNIASGTPNEFGGFINPDPVNPVKVKVAVSRSAGTGTPRVRTIVMNNTRMLADAEYKTSSGLMTVGPSIFGHNGATDALTIAATDGWDAGIAPEDFSAHGPVTHYWGPFTSESTPAQAIPAKVLDKPEFTATDNDCTTFFPSITPGPGSRCPYLYIGTSAAAPEAAGVVALMLARNKNLTPAQVKETLIASATPMSGGSLFSSGAGLIDANAALALVPLPSPPAQVPAAPQSASYKNVKKNRALVRWVGSVGASGYQVLVNEKTECTTSAARSKCRIKKAWGSRALVQVIAVGANGTSPATTAKFTRSNKPIVLGTVYFKPHSSKLVKRAKATLRRDANLLAAQGFRQVTLVGYTAKNSESSSKKSLKQLSRARAKAAKRVIEHKLDNLNVHIKITVKARGSKNPIGDNNTSKGQAKNRRTTINIR